MTDRAYAVLFGNQAHRVLHILRGDTRHALVTIRCARTLAPADLTGAQATVSLPRDGGGAIKRRTFAWAVTPVLAASTTPQSFVVAGHGFVSGDVVVLQPAAGATMPSGLVAGGSYLVTASDDNTLGFLNLDGTATDVTDAGTGQMTISLGDACTIDTPALGNIAMTLGPDVTEALSVGQAQPVQVNFTVASTTRVIMSPHGLDVVDQAFP